MHNRWAMMACMQIAAAKLSSKTWASSHRHFAKRVATAQFSCCDEPPEKCELIGCEVAFSKLKSRILSSAPKKGVLVTRGRE